MVAASALGGAIGCFGLGGCVRQGKELLEHMPAKPAMLFFVKGEVTKGRLSIRAKRTVVVPCALWT
ncbi:MAG: hypothetical protein NVSMB9_02850 [Isosphaeraceae bacterium]